MVPISIFVCQTYLILSQFLILSKFQMCFSFFSGTPQCPFGSTCKPFSEIYKNSSDFCEKVFDHSWKVVNDSTPTGCFVMWWNENDDNPNYKIALDRANQIVSSAPLVTPTCLFIALFTSIIFVFSSIYTFWLWFSYIEPNFIGFFLRAENFEISWDVHSISRGECKKVLNDTK